MFDPLPYAAYGSNLHHARMWQRCPGAVPLGSTLLPGWRLALGRFAAIARDEAARVPLGLWRVLPQHLLTLDVMEGTALGIYERVRIRLPDGAEAWTYLERRPRPGPPEAWYVRHLRHGYRDFGLDPSPLEAALSASGFAG
ncbi:gamma-glutamylcyclotransferase family protein [Falsiroseomonas oryzae]|uniref:gamma-glutamylcyclotransferase family protein n=1 Tax=Falsiroseomonas oryzae TaxID=2766473 RepID=UPI0022EB4C8F|nr:gamma-glutamylcyclotransferase family protein [Roseomonas sp. MO-31]